MFAKLRRIIFAHRIISLVAVIAIAGGGYYWYQASRGSTTVTKYVVENATLSTITTSISGSGQVGTVSSIDIKPQVTETVTKVYAKVGDKVSAGQLLVQLDTTNEAKAVKKARLSLQSAQLSSANLQEISTTTLLQSRASVTKAEQSLETASSSLAGDYQNGFDTLSATIVSLQEVMAKLEDFVLGNDVSKTQENPDA
jgi:multidrug efflux pump subunit AcrA (membrane-fusion protein)